MALAATLNSTVVSSDLDGFLGKPFQQSSVGVFNCWSSYFGAEPCGSKLGLVHCVGSSLELCVRLLWDFFLVFRTSSKGFGYLKLLILDGLLLWVVLNSQF
jgi:hypothetical protein